jgi:hypothetical protein
MSSPNTAGLDPQRSGWCTVMPYGIGNILALPVTTIEDYMVFDGYQSPGEESIDQWKSQTNSIGSKKSQLVLSFILTACLTKT